MKKYENTKTPKIQDPVCCECGARWAIITFGQIPCCQWASRDLVGSLSHKPRLRGFYLAETGNLEKPQSRAIQPSCHPNVTAAAAAVFNSHGGTFMTMASSQARKGRQ